MKGECCWQLAVHVCEEQIKRVRPCYVESMVHVLTAS